MLEIRLEANRTIQHVKRDVPRARDDWMLVRILSAPMCNEYQGYAEGRPAPMLGHEAAGVVEDAGQSDRFAVGDRVVVMPQLPCGACTLCLAGEYIHCTTGLDDAAILGADAASATFAQYILKPASQLIAIPDGYEIDHAAMACCGLGPTFGAAERMGVDHTDSVLVSGLGPVGLGGIINGKYRGALVIGADPNPYRRQLALELGADHVLDPTADDALDQIRAWTQGAGATGAVECSGVVRAQEFCLEAVRSRGRIAIVGSSKGNAAVGLGREVLFKGLTLLGSWHYNRSDTSRLMRQIGEVGPQLEIMITHRFPLSSIEEAWELQCTGQCGKVILQPWAAIE